MGLRLRKDTGFTLVELLVVIVIIALIAALLLPAIIKALCTARAGTASHLVSQLDQATESYQIDYAVYPPGTGQGTKDLVTALSKSGPKKMKYFEFPPDLLKSDGNVVNPVWADGDPEVQIIYYRLNQKSGGGSAPPPSGGGGGSTVPPVMRQSKFDMWCAGCDYTSGGANTARWSICNW